MTTKQFGYNIYVFVCGAAVMMLEFAASRLLAPFFGSSIFVWGNIIGVVLMALSLGYYVGGKLADRYPNIKTVSLLVLLASIASSLIPVMTNLLVRPLTFGLAFSIIGSFVVIVILFALPIFLLGMVSPFMIRLATSNINTAGATAGSLYAWSTMGSILGTFGSAFLVVPLLGSRETIYLSALSLALIGVISLRQIKYIPVILLPIVLYLIFYAIPVRAETNIIEQGETYYQYYVVSEEPDRYLLQYNEGLGTQSYYMKEGINTDSYYDYLAQVPELLEQPNNTLVLGLAGGTLTRELTTLYPALHLTGVEIDPAIVGVAKKYFHLDDQPINIVIADGRQFIKFTDQQYDIIYMDVFTNEYYIPWHMTTVEFFEELAARQPTNGLVAMNIGSTSEHTLLFETMLTTMQQVYPYVYIKPVPNSLNYVVVASRQDFSHAGFTSFSPSQARQVLTDNRAPVELYTETMVLKYITAHL
ncbi:MAG: fused MFS/spermidine synthase [Patescibacteria group bacterium]|jgi:spermidine synthase